MPKTPLFQKPTAPQRAIRTAGALPPRPSRRSALLWQLAALVAGALLSAGRIYGGASPFGLALLIGCGTTYLPAAALDYVRYLEATVGCPIEYVSVGADRDAYIRMF